MDDRPKTIYVKDAVKNYGNEELPELALNGLDMTVQQGTIYGLLGPSGCGKTTLLSCIIGRRKLNSGYISVLGGKPGSKESGAPGPRVGYMPQEASLVDEFTIFETIQHFGWIFDMTNEEIEERYNFLSKLLELPSGEQQAKHLSGGQQRRLSLAAAMLHEPELLILDEPTVGLDSVLRQIIWDHLKEIARTKNTTIVITTHYIEEARQADMIGLMRKGKLLAEETPERLLARHNCTTIEEVFLKLCGRQDKTEPNTHLQLVVDESTNEMSRNRNMTEVTTQSSTSSSDQSPNLDVTLQHSTAKLENIVDRREGKRLFCGLSTKGHMKAMIVKNWIKFLRYPGAFGFLLLFPFINVCGVFLAVGRDPQGLKLGIVNDELGNFSTCEEYVNFYGDNIGGRLIDEKEDELPKCVYLGLSCIFLEKFNDSLASKLYYDDREKIIDGIRTGFLLGGLAFSENYSLAYEERMNVGRLGLDNDVLEQSQMELWLDITRIQSSLIIGKKLYDKFKVYIHEVLSDCGMDSRIVSSPVQIGQPVYGTTDYNYSNYIAPGIITTSIFSLAIALSSTILVVEMMEGVWHRTLVTGMTNVELLVTQTCANSIAIFVQVLEVALTTFTLFDMPCRGSHMTLFFLMFLQGFCGMCFGFLISVSCKKTSTAHGIGLGSSQAIILASGVLWPIEAMPVALKYITSILPTTSATETARLIMERGWGMTDYDIIKGFTINVIWILIFGISSAILINKKG